MTKKTLLMMKRYGITLLGAAILAVWIFYVTNNPNIFTASVLSLQEKQFITEKGRDIAYKTSSGSIEIFMSDKIETPVSIDFTVSFNKDTVTLDTQNMSGQWISTITNQNDNEIGIKSTEIQTINKSEGILLLAFTGENKDILLSEAVATLPDGKQENLSIGTLNEIITHGK